VGTRTTITTRLLALAALLLVPAMALGAGLGKLALHSALGQQLSAQIDIVSIQRGEAGSLSARIASPEAFRQAGVDYGPAITFLRASVQSREGKHFVVLTSTEPINEPFLDVLVELTWATGRLVRQYTFLLDPVEYKGPPAPPSVAAVEAKPVEPPRAPEPAPTPAPPPKTPELAPTPITPAPAAEAPAAPAPAPMAEAPAAPAPMAPGGVGAGGTYEVVKGDTLSEIAVANLPDGVSLNQMLVALYRANEAAFINNNMNLVRAGATLKIPSKEDAVAVAREDATKVVSVQAQEFDEYRGRVATAVAMAPAREAPSQRAGGVIEPAKPAPAAPKAPAEDQLRLSRAEEASKAGKSAARADDLAARERELREQRERVTQLETNVKDMERLLELKNQQLAELQKQAEKAPAPAAKAPPPAAKAPEPIKAPAPPVAAPQPPKPAPPPMAAKAPEAPKPPEAPMAPEPAAKAPEPVAKAPEPAPEPAKAPEPVSEPVPIAKAPPVAAAPVTPEPPKPAPAKAAPPKPRPVQPPPPPETSLVDDLMSNVTDNPIALGGIGGVALLLLGYGVYAYRKKKASSLENSLAGVTTTDSSSVFGTTGGRSVDTGGSSMQTDFSQSGIGAIDTDEVDPVAEADVYMAYGRDAQAEEILKEALQKDPSRQAVRVKLLEIYAARKDVKAFETTAGEIYAATGGQGPDWEKTATLGQQIDPSNALYGGRRTEPTPGGAPPPPPPQREPTVTMSAPVAAALATPEVSSPRAAPPSIDFNIEASSGAPDIALDLSTPSQAPSDVGFDLNLGEPSVAPADQESDFSPSGTLIMDPGVAKAAQELSDGNVDMAIDFELPQSKDSAELTNTAKMMAQSQPTVVLPQSPIAQPPVGKSQPTNTMDFDFKLDEPTQEPKGGQPPAGDLSGISLDLGSSPGAGDDGGGAQASAGWQEVATKLDLAKAYEEMGDKDGARELLNEVMKEGDAAQQQKARSMLDALA
jgi:pilus assembly protein FimV